MTTQVSKQLT